MVKLYNTLETNRAAVITIIEAAINILNDSEDEVETLANLLSTQKSIDSGFESYKSQVKSNIETYIKDVVSVGIGYTGSSTTLSDVLEDLAEDMAEVPESIDGSAVAATAPTYDAQNVATLALSTPTSLSQLLTDEFWEVECLSISGGAGAETWQVRGQPHLHGVLSANLTSAVAYTALDSNGQALFTVTLTPYTAGAGYEITGDTDSELGATTWTGAVKGTNTDAAGDVFCVVALLSETEADDGSNQLSGWANITGAKLAVNADADGKVHASIVANAAVEAGDTNNEFSGWDSITGIIPATNTDAAGILYANVVDDTGGFWHVDIYKDAARTSLVGHTATYNTTGAKAIVADGASGLGGTITMGTTGPAQVTATATYTWKVNLYKAVGRTAGDLVAHSTNFTTVGAKALTADNTSGLGGTITIDAIAALDVDISCILAFRKVTVYKETGLSNIVAIGGLVSATGTVTLAAQNASGLSGTAVIAYSDGEAKVQVRVGFAAAVGDKIYFTTTNDEAGTFAEFFRRLGVALPVNLAGGETIADALAE
jgi:hypothetical protein